MKRFYFEADCGAGIRPFRNLKEAYNGIRREVGTMNNVQVVVEATAEHISWVKCMGGNTYEEHKEAR